MKIELTRKNDAFHFEAKGSTGVPVNIDAGPAVGGNDMGARPMELLLMGLGGCSAIDIISILKKQKQEIEIFDITIEAEREEGKMPSLFEWINVIYKVKGNVDEDKLKRAIDLSVEKYCSVSAILGKTANLKFEYQLEKKIE